MPLPRDLDASLTFPTRNYYCGPFKSSGGNFYFILVDLGSPNSDIEAWKSSDPDTTAFTEQDAADKPSLVTTTMGSMSVSQDGDTLHIVTEDGNIAGVNLEYHVFNMSTDNWDTTLETITTAGFNAGSEGVDISVRSDGDVVVFYNGDIATVHGTNYDRVYVAVRVASWTVDTAVDNGGAAHWHAGRIVQGSSDRMHLFFKNDDLDDGYQRTFRSDDTLETFPSAGDSVTDSIAKIFAHGFLNGTEVNCPYQDSDNTISMAELTTADSPGAFTPETGVSDNAAITISESPIACSSFDSDNSDEHLLYSEDPSQDLFRDTNAGVDVEELDAVTINDLSCNIYTRAGNIRLAYIYMDGTTPRYNEVDLGAAPSALVHVKPLVNAVRLASKVGGVLTA